MNQNITTTQYTTVNWTRFGNCTRYADSLYNNFGLYLSEKIVSQNLLVCFMVSIGFQ